MAKVVSSKQFTRRIFSWLHAIKADHANVPPVTGLAVAFQMTEYFNEDGRPCFASCKTIGEEIGKSEATVIAVVRALEAAGYLRIEWGKRGRGHSNRYWPILKPQPAKVLERQKTLENEPRKTLENESENLSGLRRTILENHGEGTPTESPSPGREREDRVRDLASRDRGRASDDAARSVEDAQGSFSQLLAIWRRGWTSDDAPKEIATARAAYAKAIAQGTQPDAILESAKTWVAAADAPRFLPPLATWLTTRGFAQPPPGKKAKRTSRSAARRSTANEVALAMLAAGEREG